MAERLRKRESIGFKTVANECARAPAPVKSWAEVIHARISVKPVRIVVSELRENNLKKVVLNAGKLVAASLPAPVRRPF